MEPLRLRRFQIRSLFSSNSASGQGLASSQVLILYRLQEADS